MGLYNEFIWPVVCPACGAGETFSFQGYIGLLQLERFQQGEDVFRRDPQLRHLKVEPDTKLEGQSFWAYGLGECPRCKVEQWARIEVRDGRFDRLVLVPQPVNVDEWGRL